MSNNGLSVSILEAVRSSDAFPVDFDQLWQWVGFSTKGNAKRVLEANFSEADFEVLIISDKNPAGGRPSEAIRLTLDAAKSFAMLAQTEVGKQVRTVFIEIEKQYRASLQAPALPANFAEALRLLASKVEANEQLALENAALKPKAEFFDAVTASEDTLGLNESAKLIGIGRNKLMELMRESGILRDNNTPYQAFIDRGYFKVVESKWTHPKTGESHITLSTRVFQSGIDYLRKKVAA